MGLPGIDVASWQGAAIDWPAVAGAGYGFALIKASEGVVYANPTFAPDWTGARAAGLVRAAYHYAQPDRNSPQAEVGLFLTCLQAGGGLATGDALALDVEAGSGDLLAWVQAWLAAVEAAVGFKPLLYSRTEFMAAHALLDASLADNGLWLAQYQSSQPPPPAPWAFVAIWQSGQGAVPGIAGPVDLDTFNGTRDQLLRYGKPAPPRLPFDEAARWQLVKYAVGGSGVADLVHWLEQYQ